MRDRNYFKGDKESRKSAFQKEGSSTVWVEDGSKNSGVKQQMAFDQDFLLDLADRIRGENK